MHAGSSGSHKVSDLFSGLTSHNQAEGFLHRDKYCKASVCLISDRDPSRRDCRARVG